MDEALSTGRDREGIGGTGKIASKARHETSAHELMARHSKAYLWTHAERDMPCHCGVMELLGPRSPWRCRAPLSFTTASFESSPAIASASTEGKVAFSLI